MRPSVIWTTILVFALAILVNFDWAIRLVFIIFAIGHLAIVHMVYDVLKNASPPPYTFDERWYCDKPPANK